jgi:hypothetical protein
MLAVTTEGRAIVPNRPRRCRAVSYVGANDWCT